MRKPGDARAAEAMTLRLFNTLTGQLDALEPADGKALRMYACGPTVYDYGHIGNFRTFLQIDILRRFLRLTGTPVRHVMNITDVDDKIIRNSAEAGISIGEYTARYVEAFFEDLEALRIERPEQIARATEHIPQMAALVEKLARAGAAYKAEDGSWYFRLKAFPEYGKLSKKDLSGMEDGARVDVDEYEKDSARDFALWKAAKPGETRGRRRSGGDGRAGTSSARRWRWSTWAKASTCTRRRRPDVSAPRERDRAVRTATHKPFARHWMHVRFLLVDGREMRRAKAISHAARPAAEGYMASAIRWRCFRFPIAAR